MHGPLADYGCLDVDSDWELGLGRPRYIWRPESTLSKKADIDRLCVACDQAGVVKHETRADVVTMAKARLTFQRQLPPQVALVNWQAERISLLSAQGTSLEGTTAERESSVPQLGDGLSAL